ncbi:hypothetical protein L5515_015450 [Caenorhabditis briggsae]|uniref:Uncharacterized protein n=1 Tax=Caenorhabditis briggsae TaxID=6238 RepID=A0AAE9EFX4_CAEBR|nr:hypothetical protein L5515_015450 [Caenorhabditis briggsae]
MIGEDNNAVLQTFFPFLGPNGGFPMEGPNYDFADHGHLAPRFCYNEPEPTALAPDAPLNHSGFRIGAGGEEIINEFSYPPQTYPPQEFPSSSILPELNRKAHETIEMSFDLCRNNLKMALEQVYGQEISQLKIQRDLLEKQVATNMEMRQNEEQWGQKEIDRLRALERTLLDEKNALQTKHIDALQAQEKTMREQYEEQMRSLEKGWSEECERKVREVQTSEANLKQELQEHKEKAKLREKRLKDVLGRSEAAAKTAEFHHGVCEERFPEWGHSSQSVLKACVGVKTELEEMIEKSSI